MSVSAYTPIYGFRLVDFNSVPWHEDEHENWRLMDSLLGAGTIPGGPYAPATGVPNAYVVTNIVPRVLAIGDTQLFKANFTNTGPSTLNVDGNGAKPLLFMDTALAAGHITLGSTASAIYQGTTWKLITPDHVNPGNPSALVDTVMQPGSSPYYMRADAAPAINQAMAPTWTSPHKWSGFTSTQNYGAVSLQPSDYGVGKPGLFLSKSTTASQWVIGLYDGASNAGNLTLAADLVSTTNDLHVTRNLTVTGYGLISDTADHATLYLDGPTGKNRNVAYRTTGVTRWQAGADTAAEGGGNIGSDFAFHRHNDAGTYIDTVMLLRRSNGKVEFAHGPVFYGSEPPFFADPGAWRDAMGVSSTLTGYLLKSANLSDVASIPAARTNLGINNVDNTSDANKPVSTAQAAADNLRLLKSDNLADIPDDAAARANIGAAGSGGITTSGLTMSPDKLLGRNDAVPGPVQEISIGTGLSLAAGVLSSTGGGAGGTPGSPTAKVGTAVVPGSALTYMRSDAAPPVDLAMTPVWSGLHTHSRGIATVVQDYVAFKPTDFGAGKPGLFIAKQSAAAEWALTLSDGVDTSGKLYLNAQNVAVLGNHTTTGNSIVTGGYMQIAPAAAANASLYFDAPAGQNKIIWLRTGSIARWSMMSNANAESGANAGSNFELVRYSDAGAVLGVALSIDRATGTVTTSSPLEVAGTSSSTLRYSKNGLLRWNATVDGSAETGSNAGSHYNIGRFTDAGVLIDFPFAINRQTGISYANKGLGVTGTTTVDGVVVINAGNATTQTDYITLRPTDMAAGKPALLFTKATTANTWSMLLWDGAGANGQINITATLTNVTGNFQSGGQTVSYGHIYAMSGYTQVESTGGASIQFRAPSGAEKAIYFMGGATRDKSRWAITANVVAESGGNAGANFAISRFNDAGGYLDAPFYIDRASGGMSFSHAPYFGGAGEGPGFAEPGFWRSALGVPGLGTNNLLSGTNHFNNLAYIGACPTMDANLAYLTVNPTGGAYAAQFMLTVAAAHNTILVRNDRTDSNPMTFYFGGTQVGAIVQNGVTVTYYSASDYRLKENIAPISNSVDVIRALNPVTFSWKSRPELGDEPGFLAHEVHAVRPHAVYGDKDAMEDVGTHYAIEDVEVDGKMVQQEVVKSEESVFIHNLPEGQRWEKTGERLKPQLMDASKLMPDVIAAMQNMLDRIEYLEAQLLAKDS